MVNPDTINASRDHDNSHISKYLLNEFNLNKNTLKQLQPFECAKINENCQVKREN